MEIKQVNPWAWQDAFNFSQLVEVQGATRTVYCAGQTSVDPSGRVLHSGDMAAQLAQAFDNLETLLAQSGVSLANVVRLNYYVTDMAAFSAAGDVVAARLGKLAVKPCGTLLGVQCLSQPGLVVEIEATAVAY